MSVPTSTVAPRSRGTFLLGVGATKAGTSWLHWYLSQSPNFVPGYRKEYHVFDALDAPSERWARKQILRAASKELQKAERDEKINAEHLHRASMYADSTFYYDYFAGLLSRRPNVCLTGDITPTYALLSAERFRDIKGQFARRQVRTAAVFLMRDPVERIYSNIRMLQGQGARFPDTAEAMVAKVHHESRYQVRTTYEKTIAKLDAVFEPEDVYYGFYEELFREPTIRAICDLLQIPYQNPGFDTRRNVSQPKSEEGLSEDVVRKVASHIAPTYIAVQERFPTTDVTAIWPSAKYVL